ncbi:hypothetical protein D6810_02115, partial [Candidatus Dojkabacteria bacterium]
RLKKIDFLILFIVSVLTTIGAAQIFSSTYFFEMGPSMFFKNHLIFVLAGFVVFFLLSMSNLKRILKDQLIFFIGLFTLLLLLSVLLFGTSAFEAKRWITIGGLTIQPSEFSKISTVIIISYCLSKIKRNDKSSSIILIVSLAFSFLVVVLVFLQKSLGNTLFLTLIVVGLLLGNIRVSFKTVKIIFTLLIFLLLSFDPFDKFRPEEWFFLTTVGAFIFIFSYLIFKRVRKDQNQNLATCFLLTILSTFALNFYPILSFSYENLLQPFQKSRIESFFKNSEENNLTTNYNREMSVLAVSSGGLIGSGFMQGRLTNSGYLPFAFTDFSFASFTEQMGVIWSFFILVLFTVLFDRIYKIWLSTEDLFLKNLVLGVGIMLFLNVYQHIGMNLGILPITGVPLPFLSYGGSALITVFIGLGIVSSVKIYNKENTF